MRKIMITLAGLLILIAAGCSEATTNSTNQSDVANELIDVAPEENDKEVIEENVEEIVEKTATDEALEKDVLEPVVETKSAPEPPAQKETVEPNIYTSSTPGSLIDNVSISPKKVYYKDGKLIMEAYIHNGLKTTISNLNEIKIELLNKEGSIASAVFAELPGVTVAQNDYVEGTFTFPDEIITNKDANLYELTWKTSVSYNY